MVTITVKQETFVDFMSRVLEEASGNMAAKKAKKKKEPAKWRPETLRALAFKLACAKQFPTAQVSVSEIVEALDKSSDEIERLNDSVKWAFIRSKSRR